MERLEQFVMRAQRRVVPGLGGCAVYPRSHDKDGYPRLIWSLAGARRPIRLCRAVVAVQEGLDIFDHSWVARHTCDNPSCINGGHLLSGTLSDNQRDMIVRGRRYQELECPFGHAWTLANTYMYRGARLCRTCRARNARDFRVRQLA